MTGSARAFAATGAAAGALVVALLVAFVLILAVAFPCLTLLRTLESSRAFATVRAPRALLSAVYPRLKTGDIVLFIAVAPSPATALARTLYSHSCALLREGGRVRTTEAQPGTELMPGPDPGGDDLRLPAGATSAPLLARLKHYAGSYYLMALSHPLGGRREVAFKAAAARLHAAAHPYPSKAQGLRAAAAGALGLAPQDPDAPRHCFQHVAHLLDAAGLTPLDLAQRGERLADAGFTQVCRAICELPGRELPDGFSYGAPVQLLYDLDAQGAGLPGVGAEPGAACAPQGDEGGAGGRSGGAEPGGSARAKNEDAPTGHYCVAHEAI